jgi:histidyl-tRNA synthetase
LNSQFIFSRSIGEASDIVHKEMFSFKDRGERNISLRPEMTASVARAVIEHGLLKTNKSLWLYYMGPMFRAERPQAGRKRQFHQMGVEIIHESNLAGFNVDFDAIFLLCKFLEYVGLKDFRLRLNDLGDAAGQQRLATKLRQYFSKQKTKLCPDCQYRLDKNVLRIFDCKNENCQPVIDKAPWDEIAPLSKAFQEGLIPAIKGGSIPYEINRRLVRGLDYYNGTVFEVVAKTGLGSQDAVAGGGRYDSLYESLGGRLTPATGFSIGVERLLQVLEVSGSDAFKEMGRRRFYFACLIDDFEGRKMISEQMLLLEKDGLWIETTWGETDLGNHLRRANQLKSDYLVIWGENEVKKKKFTLKNLKNGSQEEVAFSELVSKLRGLV